MKTFSKILSAGLIAVATGVSGQEAIVTNYSGSFEDATFAVENAIVNQGLVIDYVSHVGEMLNRTGEDVGSDQMLFDEADIFIFCSAVVSRQVMEADPMNIVHCPYGVFVTQKDDAVMIGYRDYPDGPMQAVEDLLAGIVSDAVAN